MVLDFAEQMMAMDLDPDNKHFARLVGIKQQVMGSVLTVMARVRPGDLRDRPDDGLDDLLRRTATEAGAELERPPAPTEAFAADLPLDPESRLSVLEELMG